jgi:hypothetical protein
VDGTMRGPDHYYAQQWSIEMDENKKAREAIEGLDAKPTEGLKPPVAGPHAKKGLTDESKTPGAGALPDRDDESVMPGAG